MEGLLRSEEEFELIESLFNKTFDYNEPCVLFPVRHHSPSCSYHLGKVMEEYKPDVVLIEGPENADELIPFIASEDTKAPFCMYLSYDDKEGKIDKEPNKYRAYYPFLEYSPELHAIRMAKQMGADCKFIDLTYADKLLNTPEADKSKEPYHDDKTFTLSNYYKVLTEKTGCRNFNELWEMLFELNGCYIDTREFIKNLFTYCYYTRLYTDEKEEVFKSDKAREYAMIMNLENARRSYKRILVITGGIHTIALSKYLILRDEERADVLKEGNNIKRLKKEDTPVYLMPYSYEESDQASGYESGMVFPYYYQKVWEGLKKKKKLPYEEAALYFIIQTAAGVRKKQPVSIADEMQSFYMAKGLAALREKKECGVFELIDSVKSSFVKGEINSFYQPALKGLYRLLTGMEVGQVDTKAGVPPIVNDFLLHCKKFKIQTNTSLKKETKLDIYNKQDHREKSYFFRQMEYLDMGFCVYLKGQDDNGNTGRILLRESWEYRFWPHVQASLIQSSVYGATLRQASLSMISKQLKEEHYTAKELAALLLKAEQMGLFELYGTLTDLISELIGNDMDFISVMDCFETLCYIHNKVKLFEEIDPLLSADELIKIKKLTLNRGFTLFYTILQVNKDEEGIILKKIKYLYQYFIEEKGTEEDLFLTAIESLYKEQDIDGGLAGICAGVLLKNERMELSDAFQRFSSYISGTEEAKKSAALFVKGFFMVAKDVIFVDDSIILLLDEILRNTDGELFLSILPELRLAFTYFMPFETDRIAKRVSEIYGTGIENVLYVPAVNQSELEEAARIDKFCAERRSIWFD